MKEYYLGTYTDQFATTPIIIENDFETFKIEIRGFSFEADNLDDLCLKDKNNICIEKLTQCFEFESLTSEDLQLTNYQLHFKIPIIFIEIATKKEISVDVEFNFELKKGYELCKVSFNLMQQHFEASIDFLEIVFDQIQHQFKGQYRFKNCYGCLYADYSIYGQGFIGSMACFKSQEKQYLAVQNEAEYMQLAITPFCNQEIYCCENYEIRDRNVGYRGCVK